MKRPPSWTLDSCYFGLSGGSYSWTSISGRAQALGSLYSLCYRIIKKGWRANGDVNGRCTAAISAHQVPHQRLYSSMDNSKTIWFCFLFVWVTKLGQLFKSFGQSNCTIDESVILSLSVLRRPFNAFLSHSWHTVLTHRTHIARTYFYFAYYVTVKVFGCFCVLFPFFFSHRRDAITIKTCST